MGKYLKDRDPDCKNSFIGPCTAKKNEFQKEEYHGIIDSVITFEELQALIDSKNVPVNDLAESEIKNASYYGRIFARSGGLTESVLQAAKESGSDFEIKPVICNGMDECRIALMKASKGVLNGNFIEGMACVGGCIGGAGCLSHEEKSVLETEKYGKLSDKQTITESVDSLK